MDQTSNSAQFNTPEDQRLEGRRDAVRKLGKYVVYAAPFTLLASNVKAIGGGSGHGGGPSSAILSARRR